MNIGQLEKLQILCADFRRDIRTMATWTTDAYVKEMLDDMDKLVAMRLECVKEACGE